MAIGDSDKRAQRAGAAVAVAGALLFLAALAAYPGLAHRILEAHPAHYRANVAQSAGQGRMGQALRQARYAAKTLRLDPDAHVLWGVMALERGREREAASAFKQATAITSTPGPDYRPTPWPFYHTQARLGLGALAWKDGEHELALAEFDRAFVHDPPNPETTEAPLFEAYASAGDWDRALDFGAPGADLPALDADAALGLAWAALFKEPGLAQQAAAHALEAGASEDQGQYMLGRAALLREDAAARPALDAAAKAGHDAAPFFLALTLDGQAAREAFARVPAGSFYAPLAYALAGPAMADACRDALLARLDQQPLLAQDPHERFQLVGAWFDEAALARRRVPVLAVWRDTAVEDAPEPPADVRAAPDGSGSLRFGAYYFVWRELENAVRDPSRMPAGRETPGCEVLRRFSKDRGTRVVREEGAAPVMRLTDVLVGSHPVRVEPGQRWFWGVKMDAPASHAGAGYYAWDAEGRGVDVCTLAQGGDGAEQHWRRACLRAKAPWRWLGLRLGWTQGGGQADFAHLALFRLETPEEQGLAAAVEPS